MVKQNRILQCQWLDYRDTCPVKCFCGRLCTCFICHWVLQRDGTHITWMFVSCAGAGSVLGLCLWFRLVAIVTMWWMNMFIGGATVVPEAGTVINGECVVTSTLTAESVHLELKVRRVSYTTVPHFGDDMTCDNCYSYNCDFLNPFGNYLHFEYSFFILLQMIYVSQLPVTWVVAAVGIWMCFLGYIFGWQSCELLLHR